MRHLNVAALAALAISGTALAQPSVGGNAVEGGAIFSIDPGSNTGAGGNGANTSFQVSGFPGLNYLPNAWWWMRVDGVDTRENALFRPDANTVVSNPAANQLQIVYNYGTFTIRMRFSVADDGAGSATLVQSVRIQNNDLSNGYSINLFNYNNIDVFGTPGNDTAIQTGPNTVTLSDGILPFVTAAFEGANFIRVDTRPNVLGLLTNAGIDNMIGGVINNGPADLELATQFQFNLAPGGVQTVTSSITIIPTPGAAALLGLGGLMAARRRRA